MVAKGAMNSLVVVVVVVVVCGGGGVHGEGYSDGVRSMLQRQGAQLGHMYLPLRVNPNSPCGQALAKMSSSLASNDSLWAAEMVDSWGKMNDGTVFGNYVRWGVFDECLVASSPDGDVKGKYCQVAIMDLSAKSAEETHNIRSLLAAANIHLNTNPPLTLSHLKDMVRKEPRAATISSVYGTCMPDVCTAKELSGSIQADPQMIGRYAYILSCSMKDREIEFTTGDAGFMAFFTFILALVICASIVDIVLEQTKQQHLTKGILRYLMVFSAYSNISKIMQVNNKATPGTITCLHGMRVLSMTWVIWAHQQGIASYSIANYADIGKYMDGLLEQTLTNGFPSVDTFFFLSGFLVSFSVLRELKRTGSFNAILYYFHRVLRLLPPIALVAGAMATVVRFFAVGPFSYIWNLFIYENCRNHWWRDLIFVSNFFTEMDDAGCVGQAWYLGADTQMFIVAPLVIVPLFFFKATGKVWLYVVTAISAIIPAAIIYSYDLPPTSLMGSPLTMEYFNLVYMKPWCRAEPYMAGIWLGYIFFNVGNKRYKMSPLVVTTGWTLASITGLLVVYGMANYNNPLNPFPFEMMTQVVYGGGHRLAWGAALAWVVFACHHGYGGVVNQLLSHPVWQPISRLTYATYLIAMPLQMFLSYTRHSVFYFTFLYTTIDTVGSLVLSMPLALLVSLMVESPIMGLEKLLLRPNRSPPPPQAKTDIDAASHPLTNHDELNHNIEESKHSPDGHINTAFTMDQEGEDGSVQKTGNHEVVEMNDYKKITSL